MPLSIVCLVFSIVLLVVQMGSSSQPPAFLPEAIKVPAAQLSPWEKSPGGLRLPDVP